MKKLKFVHFMLNTYVYSNISFSFRVTRQNLCILLKKGLSLYEYNNRYDLVDKLI